MNRHEHCAGQSMRYAYYTTLSVGLMNRPRAVINKEIHHRT